MSNWNSFPREYGRAAIALYNLRKFLSRKKIRSCSIFRKAMKNVIEEKWSLCDIWRNDFPLTNVKFQVGLAHHLYVQVSWFRYIGIQGDYGYARIVFGLSAFSLTRKKRTKICTFYWDLPKEWKSISPFNFLKMSSMVVLELEFWQKIV